MFFVYNIPRNIYYAAEAKYANTENNVVWATFQPTVNGKAVSTSDNTVEESHEGITNPKTGASASLIALILIALSYFEVSYYNKYYTESNDEIINQKKGVSV